MTAQGLTCPGLVANVHGSDPVGELLATHFPDAVRTAQLSVDQVPMDAQGLTKLVVS